MTIIAIAREGKGGEGRGKNIIQEILLGE